MSTSDLPVPAPSSLRSSGGKTGRRALLKQTGLVIGLASLSGLAAACSAAAASAPTPEPTEVPPTSVPPPTIAAQPTTAPTSTAAPGPSATAVATPATAKAPAATAQTSASGVASGAANVVNVEVPSTYEFSYKLDKLEIPSGDVTLRFKNNGKLSHELMIFPQQDLTALLTQKRKGNDVDEAKYIKPFLKMTDEIEAGKTADLEVTLTPGQYELSCMRLGKNPDGSTFVHYDRGQFATLKVTPPSSAPVATPADQISVEMKGEDNGTWLFVPDKLVVPAGSVTFQVTNTEKVEHDFVVHQVGDGSQYTRAILSGKMSEDDAVQQMLGVLKGEKLIEDLATGKTDQKSMQLSPGRYVAACYMLSKAADGSSFIHRDRGQHFVFDVK